MKLKTSHLLLSTIVSFLCIRKSSEWNRQAYEFSRQLREHAREQWQYQLDHERKDHEEYQEAETQSNDQIQRDIEDGNRKIQEGDEDFHETFEANREKGTPDAAFSKRARVKTNREKPVVSRKQATSFLDRTSA